MKGAVCKHVATLGTASTIKLLWRLVSSGGSHTVEVARLDTRSSKNTFDQCSILITFHIAIELW